jgi:hypothetical protein
MLCAGFPSVTILHGRTYHLLIPGDVDGPLLRWLLDLHADHALRLQSSAVDRQDFLFAIDALRLYLREHNPYVQALRQLAPAAAAAAAPVVIGVPPPPLPNVPIAVVLRDPPSTAAGRDEMCMLLHQPQLTATSNRRYSRYGAVVFFASADAARAAGVTRDPRNSGRSFVSTNSALYTRLQYPLLFPNGTGGWYLRCRQPRHDNDTNNDSDDDGQANDYAAPATQGARSDAVDADVDNSDNERVGRRGRSEASQKRWERPTSTANHELTRAAYVKHQLYQVRIDCASLHHLAFTCVMCRVLSSRRSLQSLED